jgi:hypothetical protein
MVLTNYELPNWAYITLNTNSDLRLEGFNGVVGETYKFHYNGKVVELECTFVIDYVNYPPVSIFRKAN